MLADHQRLAVTRAMEAIGAHGGVLLADAVGLGKSFVAAGVAQALGLPVELIVPAGLIEQWRSTLSEFGLVAELFSHDEIARRTRSVGAERLVVVDEAHEFRNPRTKRYDALARRTIGAKVLLVTATPLCNSARDLHALLQLIAADDALAFRGVPSIDLAFERGDRAAIDTILAELMIRRDRDAVSDGLRFGVLEREVIWHPLPEVPFDALSFPLVDAAPLLRRFLHRRLESSEAAALESVRRQRRFYERVLESGRPLTKRDYRRAFGHEEDDASFQQVLFWEFWSPPGELEAGAICAEMARLDEAAAAIGRSPRRKLALLREVVAAAGEPALIFTGSAATAREIAGALRCGIATARDGRGDIESFRRGRVDVLVATDLASEGLNLQRAGVVVHYDIPWNPVRLEQRNGRAHRIGQKRPSVRAVYFLPERDRTRILATMTAKNRQRRAIVRARPIPPSIGAGRTALRPRLVGSAAAAHFFSAIERCGLEAPESLERRHRAGLDRLLEDFSRGAPDRAQLDRLLAVAATER